MVSFIFTADVAGTLMYLPAASFAIAALPFFVQYAVSALR